MRTFNRISILFVIILGLLFTACKEEIDKLNENAEALINVLDDGIDKIVDQSSDWQETLIELENNLATHMEGIVSTTLQEDLPNLIDGSIASLGIEARCTGATVKIALQNDLKEMKNNYLDEVCGEKDKKYCERETVVHTPINCQSVPDVLGINNDKVSFYGSGFVDGYVDAYLIKVDGSKQLINEYLSKESRYKITILIGGLNGLPVSIDNRKIILQCDICEDDRKIISQVPFNYGNLEEVQTDIDPSDPHTFCPVLTDGTGNWRIGVSVDGTVELELKNNDTEIWAKVKADFADASSKAIAIETVRIWTAPLGRRIHSIDTFSPNISFSYIDADNSPDYSPDEVSLSGGDFISRVKVVGLTSGTDLPCNGSSNNNTHFQIWFKPFSVVLI